MNSVCTIELPDNYHRNDFLDYHRRDAAMLAERVDQDTLVKGITWEQQPARLTIRFFKQHAEAELSVDGWGDGAEPYDCKRIAGRMLGLEQKVDDFVQQHAKHPQLGRLVTQRPGLRVPLAATPYEALTWAVIGQQISVKAAVSIRRNFIKLAGVRDSSGLWCYPDAERVSHLAETNLRGAGFSMGKTRTIIELSHRIRNGQLVLHEALNETSVAQLRSKLLQIRGIGPWTVNYTLLRGLGWLDGELHGDVAVRRGIQALLNSPEKLTEEQARTWLAPFTPWRALVAAHLWKMQSLSA